MPAGLVTGAKGKCYKHCFWLWSCSMSYCFRLSPCMPAGLVAGAKGSPRELRLLTVTQLWCTPTIEGCYGPGDHSTLFRISVQ